MSNSSNKNIKEWATYFLEGYELIVGPILLTSKNENLLVFIGRAKRAPHWGVQSRFRVIYIYSMYVYDCLWETHTKICMLK